MSSSMVPCYRSVIVIICALLSPDRRQRLSRERDCGRGNDAPPTLRTHCADPNVVGFVRELPPPPPPSPALLLAAVARAAYSPPPTLRLVSASCGRFLQPIDRAAADDGRMTGRSRPNVSRATPWLTSPPPSPPPPTWRPGAAFTDSKLRVNAPVMKCPRRDTDTILIVENECVPTFAWPHEIRGGGSG